MRSGRRDWSYPVGSTQGGIQSVLSLFAAVMMILVGILQGVRP
jgi:hypothetical protein